MTNNLHKLSEFLGEHNLTDYIDIFIYDCTNHIGYIKIIENNDLNVCGIIVTKKFGSDINIKKYSKCDFFVGLNTRLHKSKTYIECDSMYDLLARVIHSIEC